MMQILMWIAWPSFLMAGLIEMLVFSFVDPQEIVRLSELDWPRSAVYTLAFFLLWAIVALSSALTLYLSKPETAEGGTFPPQPYRRGPNL